VHDYRTFLLGVERQRILEQRLSFGDSRESTAECYSHAPLGPVITRLATLVNQAMSGYP
jgi:hypothetical protein